MDSVTIALKKDLLRKKIALLELEITAEKDRFLPHRREYTKVFLAPDHSGWYCTLIHQDRGDVIGRYPVGFGFSPAEAQEAFDKAWYSHE